MRILLVTSSLPWPTHGGVNQRTNLLYRSLSELGQVDTVLLSRYGKTDRKKWRTVVEGFRGKLIFEERLPEHRAPVRWASKLSAGLPNRLTHMVGGWGIDFKPDAHVAKQVRALVDQEDYDLIVGRYMWPLARSGVVGMRPTFLDVDDFETDIIECEIQLRKPMGLQKTWLERRLKQVAQVERRVLDHCDHVWVAKPRDTMRVGHDRHSLLPNIPFVKADQHTAEPCLENPDSRVIMIVGTLEHPVNVRAIESFIAGLWPKIRQAVPDAVFRIVGSGMTSEMKESWGQVPGIDPVGFVEDVRMAYEESALTVVPIREGGGTKIKVLESLMMGRVCVTVPHSLRGYEDVLVHGQSIFIALSDEELIDGCVDLLNHPEKREALAAAGRKQVCEHFSYERFARAVHKPMTAITSLEAVR